MINESEPRYECPVCLGIKLEKLLLSDNLLLDACSRCGGIWFDYSEVHALRECRPKALWQHVAEKTTPHLMKCHSCQASMNANALICPVCAWDNNIDCPVCERKMTSYTELQLDICKSCKGVWFDNEDLSRIWNGHLDKVTRKELARHRMHNAEAESDVPLFLDVLLQDPSILHVVVEGGFRVGSLAARAASNAPEVASDVIEDGADLAGDVFGAIAEVIGDIFGGL